MCWVGEFPVDLGAAQDFNTVNVDYVQHRTDAAGVIDTVHVDAYTRVGGRQKVALSDTAQEHGCTIAAAAVVLAPIPFRRVVAVVPLMK